MIVETVRNVGQNLRDKGTIVTRKLAERCDVLSYLCAWKIERDSDTQKQIDELSAQIRKLESIHPIVEFTTRQLSPTLENRLEVLAPSKWAQWILAIHRKHHERFHPLMGEPVNKERMYKAIANHPLAIAAGMLDRDLFDSL